MGILFPRVDLVGPAMSQEVLGPVVCSPGSGLSSSQDSKCEGPEMETHEGRQDPPALHH